MFFQNVCTSSVLLLQNSENVIKIHQKMHIVSEVRPKFSQNFAGALQILKQESSEITKIGVDHEIQENVEDIIIQMYC